uniref:Uncharacterized protein n=1 Tax=Melopsittacus undulatus TaxID=13146 RepID=A0A8C6JP93_MELUD
SGEGPWTDPPPDLLPPVPAAASCPRSLDCALQRREFCPPGSGACGPCLASFQEDEHGRCVQKQLPTSAHGSPWLPYGVIGWWLLRALLCPCRLQKEVRLAQKVDYSTQRVASPLPYDKISPGDKTLAQSAQMYHYQHQKQQMLSMEKHKEEPKLPDSASSDEENEDGDFTVYECPGLAPTGEMEVRNPLFDDSSLHPSNPKSHQ